MPERPRLAWLPLTVPARLRIVALYTGLCKRNKSTINCTESNPRFRKSASKDRGADAADPLGKGS